MTLALATSSKWTFAHQAQHIVPKMTAFANFAQVERAMLETLEEDDYLESDSSFLSSDDDASSIDQLEDDVYNDSKRTASTVGLEEQSDESLNGEETVASSDTPFSPSFHSPRRTTPQSAPVRRMHLSPGMRNVLRAASLGDFASFQLNCDELVQIKQVKKVTEVPGVPSPVETYKKLLKTKGIVAKSFSFKEVDFLKNGKLDSSHYTNQLTNAVRNNDMETIIQLYHENKLCLRAANAYGESVVHTAVRKGSMEVLRFLVHVAKVPVKVACQMGRTPMHDACWNGEPSWEVVQFIMTCCPDLLYVQDSRGYTPLQYVPNCAWAAWNDFLDKHSSLLRPRLLLED